MMQLLKSYQEPTTIYVLGCWFEKVKETFKITDDYTSCDCITTSSSLKVADYYKVNRFIETCGFVYILTEEELVKAKESIEMTSLSDEGFRVDNFIGEIYVDVINDDGVSVLKEDANMQDYLLYEVEDTVTDRELRLLFPEGSLFSATPNQECGLLLGYSPEDYD